MFAVKSVLAFSAGVIFLIFIGVAMSMVVAIGTLSTWNDNLDQNAWRLVYSVIIYFVAIFAIFNIALLFTYVRKIKLSKIYSQELEYAYLILTIISLLAVSEVIPNIAKLRTQTQENFAKLNFGSFRGETEAALKVCAQAVSQPPSVDLWPKACKWVSDASQLGEQEITERSWERIDEERLKIKQKWQEFWEHVRSDKGVDPNLVPDPLTLRHPDGSTSSVLLLTELMDSGIRGFLENKKVEQTLKTYVLPPTFFIIRLYASFILAFALALRLARATGEAAGLFGK